MGLAEWRSDVIGAGSNGPVRSLMNSFAAAKNWRLYYINDVNSIHLPWRSGPGEMRICPAFVLRSITKS